MIIFTYLIFKTVRGQKIGFNNCECSKFLNIANIHVLDVCGSAYLFEIIKYFSFAFSVYSICKETFFHSGYVMKPPQPSSAIYGAPPFIGNLLCDRYESKIFSVKFVVKYCHEHNG